MDQASNDFVINQCPECNQDLDVSALAPFAKIVCPYCDTAVRVRTRLGQYEIKSLLGEGGMSQVFAADDLTLGRRVALKILHQSLSLDTKLTAMFEREAKLTASINHPNVVKVYTVGQEHGYFYIAMELVDAVSVEEMIAQTGAHSEQTVLNIAYDVVSGLKAAYQNNLIHRDIKPGNMLVTKDGTAKLVDFGLAVAQGKADENEDLWATPFYVPPEKLVREPDTHLGDIYALGATCYHAIAGVPPFMANTSSLEELIEIKSAGVDLKSAAPHVSKPAVKLFEQMMAHTPADRPPTYDKLLEQIVACQGTQTANIGGARAHTPTSTTTKSGVGALVKVGLAALILGGGAIFFLNRGEGGPNELDSLLIGSGERVISTGEREAATKMLAGRNAMVKGRLSEAQKIFQDLEGNTSFTQPTKAWNSFNQGLVALMNGKEKVARTAFATLESQAGFDDPALKPYRKFFKEIGQVMSDPLPVLRSDISPQLDSFTSVGLLAAGLKNWELNQFEEASLFFKDFAKVENVPTDQWITGMQPMVNKYRTDFKVYKDLPNPSRKMSKGDLAAAKQKLEQAAAALTTKGSMTDFLTARASRAAALIKLADAPKPKPKDVAPPSSGEWTDAEKAELSGIQSLINSFTDYKSTYLFSGAVLKLESATGNSPRGKALKSDLIEGYRSADSFIQGLANRLNPGVYEGTIIRKQGVPLDAKITAATNEFFTIDLGFGTNEVEIEKFDPKWMIEAATKTLGEPSQENVDSWKEVFWFANVCGYKSEATRIAVKLVAIDEAFKEAGRRFSKVRFP